VCASSLRVRVQDKAREMKTTPQEDGLLALFMEEVKFVGEGLGHSYPRRLIFVLGLFFCRSGPRACTCRIPIFSQRTRCTSSLPAAARGLVVMPMTRSCDTTSKMRRARFRHYDVLFVCSRFHILFHCCCMSVPSWGARDGTRLEIFKNIKEKHTFAKGEACCRIF